MSAVLEKVSRTRVATPDVFDPVVEGIVPPPEDQGARILRPGPNHMTPVGRVEDDKMACEFGLAILNKRLGELGLILKKHADGEVSATSAWTQINAVIARG